MFTLTFIFVNRIRNVQENMKIHFYYSQIAVS
mgnify:CR=1 FL=1